MNHTISFHAYVHPSKGHENHLVSRCIITHSHFLRTHMCLLCQLFSIFLIILNDLGYLALLSQPSCFSLDENNLHWYKQTPLLISITLSTYEPVFSSCPSNTRRKYLFNIVNRFTNTWSTWFYLSYSLISQYLLPILCLKLLILWLLSIGM